MEKRKHRLGNPMNDGLGRDLMNAGRFCFSCEQIFASRKCLEEHVCSSTSFICSCGTEFTEYKNMLEHSTMHEPGQQVLDHETIKKRRMEKRKEEEQQLERIETGEVVWKAPEVAGVPSVSLPVRTCQLPSMLPAHKQGAKISQVPELYSPLSKTSIPPKPIHKSDGNVFAEAGAPTVDLWTLYQPVVLLKMDCKFIRQKPFICGKCGQCFVTKISLITHHNTHVTDKVSGCVGCGVLLSSKKLVPRFHVCNSPNTAMKFRIITARPLRQNQVFKNKSLNQNVSGQQTTSCLKHSTARKEILGSHVTSTLQMKSRDFPPYLPHRERFGVTPSSQMTSQNPSASKSYISICYPPKLQSPNSFEFNVNGSKHPVTSSRELKTPVNSPLVAWGKPTKTSAAQFVCRVCQITFETAQLLQRHKCVKAREFMARHMPSGRQQYKLWRVAPVADLNAAHTNQKDVPAYESEMKNQVVATDLNKEVVPVNSKMEADMDDDCYIVENEPDKPAEMIYQVTSSVPITI